MDNKQMIKRAQIREYKSFSFRKNNATLSPVNVLVGVMALKK